MLTLGSVVRPKERKDGDSGLLNRMLQELRMLNSKMDMRKVVFERQFNSKVDRVDSLIKLVIENRDCLKPGLAQTLKH